MFGTEWCLGHCTILQLREEHEGRWDRRRSERNGQNVWWMCTHTQTRTWIYALEQMYILYTGKQTDRHTPSSHPAPHRGDGYFGKDHSIRTHIAFSTAPFLLSPASAASSFSLRSSSTPFLSLFCVNTSFPTCFQSRSFSKTLQLFSNPLGDYFAPHILACVTPQSCFLYKVMVS